MEGDSFALEFSDQASLEDQLLVTPNDETISLSSILGRSRKQKRTKRIQNRMNRPKTAMGRGFSVLLVPKPGLY